MSDVRWLAAAGEDRIGAQQYGIAYSTTGLPRLVCRFGFEAYTDAGWFSQPISGIHVDRWDGGPDLKPGESYELKGRPPVAVGTTGGGAMKDRGEPASPKPTATPGGQSPDGARQHSATASAEFEAECRALWQKCILNGTFESADNVVVAYRDRFGPKGST